MIIYKGHLVHQCIPILPQICINFLQFQTTVKVTHDSTFILYIKGFNLNVHPITVYIVNLKNKFDQRLYLATLGHALTILNIS